MRTLGRIYANNVDECIRLSDHAKSLVDVQLFRDDDRKLYKNKEKKKKKKKKKEEEKEIKKMKKKSRAFVSSVMGEQKFTDNNNKETIWN